MNYLIWPPPPPFSTSLRSYFFQTLHWCTELQRAELRWHSRTWPQPQRDSSSRSLLDGNSLLCCLHACLFLSYLVLSRYCSFPSSSSPPLPPTSCSLLSLFHIPFTCLLSSFCPMGDLLPVSLIPPKNRGGGFEEYSFIQKIKLFWIQIMHSPEGEGVFVWVFGQTPFPPLPSPP